MPADMHTTTMGILREIRTMLDTLPLEWQIAVVKALTARTILKARERLQPIRALSA